MGILDEIEPLFGSNKLPSTFDFKPCISCNKAPAIWECSECGTCDSKAYYCEKHIKRVPEHKDVEDNGKRKRHDFRRIVDEMRTEELKEQFTIDLDPAINDLQAQLKAERSHLTHAVKEAKNAADFKINRLCEQFYSEIDLLRQRVYNDIDKEARCKVERIQEMEQKAKDTNKKFHKLGEIKDPELYDRMQKEILINWMEMDEYIPFLGPFLEFDGIDTKKIAHMMVSHRVKMEQVDVVRSEGIRWRPITPSMHHMYTAEHHLPQWCLHDLPLVMVPHPDYDTNGPAAREQIRLLSTMAVECERVMPVKNVYELSNKIGLLKCEDGIVRRVSVRILHDKFFDPNALRHDFVLELQGAFFASNDFTASSFTDEIDKEIERVQGTGAGKVRLRPKVKGSTRDAYVYHIEFADFAGMEVAKTFFKNYKHDIKVHRRSNCILVFVDEHHRAPIVVDDDLKSPKGQPLQLYHPDPKMNFLKYPPMAVEVWIESKSCGSHSALLNVEDNFEPFRAKLIHNEVGWALRSLLKDGNDFRVEFHKQIHRDMPWCWIGTITCDGENLRDKTEGIHNSRSHFPIPKEE